MTIYNRLYFNKIVNYNLLYHTFLEGQSRTASHKYLVYNKLQNTTLLVFLEKMTHRI